MWLVFAFVSATIVGIRDFFKKIALQRSTMLLVLCLVTVFSALLFMPFIVVSRCTDWLDGSFFYVPESSLTLHLCSLVKCALLILCWLCSFDGIKHLPLTVSGMIAAFGPVETVLAAMLIYGESLSALQWTGVLVSTVSLVSICRGGGENSANYFGNRHFWLMLLSTVFSAMAALWDKFAVGRPEDGGLGQSVMFIQSWYNIYQAVFLTMAFLAVRHRSRNNTDSCKSSPLPTNIVVGILAVSVCEVAADLLYDAALQLPGCLVSILAMVRRGSVVVSFILGAVFLKERDIRRKAVDLAMVLLGMVLLFFGS